MKCVITMCMVLTCGCTSTVIEGEAVSTPTMDVTSGVTATGETAPVPLTGTPLGPVGPVDLCDPCMTGHFMFVNELATECASINAVDWTCSGGYPGVVMDDKVLDWVEGEYPRFHLGAHVGCTYYYLRGEFVDCDTFEGEAGAINDVDCDCGDSAEDGLVRAIRM